MCIRDRYQRRVHGEYQSARTMKALILLLLIGLNLCSQPDFSFYHTSDQIDNHLDRLAKDCKARYTMRQISNSPGIMAVDLTGNNTPTELTQEKMKVFLLFGEHARELISPETGLNLVNTLCGLKENPRFNVDSLLEKTEFRIVLNANPESRRAVESGKYCLRENEHGVDLNRNWDDHWEKSEDHQRQTTSGPYPFSEKESSAVRDSLTEFMPKVFLTVHSGTFGMYTPYAYSKKTAKRNEDAMLEVTNNLNQKYCNCPCGAAGREVGYVSPGTCLDYAYDQLDVPWSFAWEIYSSERKEQSFLQIQQSAKKGFLAKEEDAAPSCFLQTGNTAKAEAKMMLDCFGWFNPTSQNEYHSVVENWTDAILDMTEQIHTRDPY
eukprot:TRINITY_DN672_c0_g1_i1.p1 TRINITY_DN672_c0_g1~~TRINITY_DN672_c0_g1_i1.p1  ORF type:complete len:401 (-),score=117.39 TRINITY_DN672_c0_g1_i1:1081-2217(-)